MNHKFLVILLLVGLVFWWPAQDVSAAAQKHKAKANRSKMTEVTEECVVDRATGREFCQVVDISPAPAVSAERGATPSRQNETRETPNDKQAIASVGKRVALVIGNSKYLSENLPELPNPVHDAEDIAKALRGFGFEVIERKNQSKEDIDAAITEFGRKIGNSEAALFYFAGHGLQVKGQNYLIPVDAKIESEAQVPYKSINVNQLLEEMDNGQSLANIVILDACRNNPISGKFRSAATRGLAPPISQPKGTIIVYATDPGNTALDGEGRNGLFTAGLLTAFRGDDLSLDGVLTRASEEVERGSQQKQTPYVNGPKTLQKNFQFLPGVAKQAGSQEMTSAPATNPTERPSATPDPAGIELSFWESIQDSDDPADFRAYLTKYPNGQFEAIAHNRLKSPVPAALSVEPASNNSNTENVDCKTNNDCPNGMHCRSKKGGGTECKSTYDSNISTDEAPASTGKLDSMFKKIIPQDSTPEPVATASTGKMGEFKKIILQDSTPEPVTTRHEPTITIGSKGPHGGIVFYIDSSGSHGLETKAADEDGSLTWNAAMTTASTHGSSWHLPTKDELNLLYRQKAIVGGFDDDLYWSSTEYDSRLAWFQSFLSGNQSGDTKAATYRVRAVRAF